jgi:hypothetical protein
MWKMTAASIINVSILGFMVHVAIDPDMGDSQEKNWYVKGGLAHDVILIGMTNVFVTPFIGLLSPWNIPFYLKRLTVSPLHSRMSQEDLVDLYGGSEFRLAYRYSAVFKTLFFTLLYAPLAPAVLLPFGVCTLMAQYCVDKFHLIRLSRRPPWQGHHLHRAACQMLPLLLMVIPLCTPFLLRGTSLNQLAEWSRSCRLTGISHTWRGWSDTRLYLWLPIALGLIVAFGKGGYKACYTLPHASVRCVTSICSLLFSCLIRGVLCLASFGMLVWADAAEEQRVGLHMRQQVNPISYYKVQKHLSAKYRLSNPLYLSLPSRANPTELHDANDEKMFKNGGSSPIRSNSGRLAASQRFNQDLVVGTSTGISLRSALKQVVENQFEDGEEEVGASMSAQPSFFGQRSDAVTRTTLEESVMHHLIYAMPLEDEGEGDLLDEDELYDDPSAGVEMPVRSAEDYVER